ncbi:hypothetical protein B9G98_01212 [Wickerhamiella sorbophila]|uniref:EamA domain-containing protein n=1 Tax=Wickerhamiella sorbophila TaxID=45607 RepID=A0A2T0FF18_9ASCO|nr:hypothetical protein B9G98_01212 [Wickerhamiella sorbophila]PRT53592.1 hypothetical protein B9G98_01212 [Wickerhamiella sorbophila]
MAEATARRDSEEEVLFESDIELSDLNEQAVPKPTVESGLWSYLTPGCQLYLVAMLCGEAMKALSKLLMEKIDMMVLIFTRMSITLCTTVLYMWYKNIDHYFWGPPGVRLLITVRGVSGTVAIVLTMFALKHLSLPEQTVLTFLGPQVAPVLARIILHEQYFWQQAAWGLVSFSGVVVVAKPPPFHHEETTGSESSVQLRVLAIMATLFVVLITGIVMIVVRSIGTRAHPLCVVGSYSMFSVLLSAAWMIADPSRITVPKTIRTWVLLVGTGLFGFCLQYMTAVALQKEQVSMLAGFRYTQILWAVVFELILWRDLPDLWTITGSILVAIGVIQATIVRKRLTEASKPST